MNYPRVRARRFALQALYQWQMAGQNLASIEQQFIEDPEMNLVKNKIDLSYFKELLHQIPAQCSALDAQLELHMNRTMASVDPVERAILRMGAYELMFRMDVPYRIILNEAIELAKMFGAEQSHRFVNGVLDKVRHQVRRSENRIPPSAPAVG